MATNTYCGKQFWKVTLKSFKVQAATLEEAKDEAREILYDDMAVVKIKCIEKVIDE